MIIARFRKFRNCFFSPAGGFFSNKRSENLSIDMTAVVSNDILMKKLLRPKDILLLTIAGIGDIFQEISDPMQIMAKSYEAMYGFIPRQYTRKNFYQAVWRSVKTGDIEKVIKNNKAYLRLTTAGKSKVKRDFPLTGFSRKWNKKWVILIFDIEEKSRELRNILRNKLKNIGFGMLQQSVWITPLPIAKDMTEFVSDNNFKEYVFILEVSSVLLGDPKELARRIWHLDDLEEMQIDLNEEKKGLDKSLENLDGRLKNGDINDTGNIGNTENKEKIEIRKKELKKKQLELTLSLPFLFTELLPLGMGR